MLLPIDRTGDQDGTKPQFIGLSSLTPSFWTITGTYCDGAMLYRGVSSGRSRWRLNSSFISWNSKDAVKRPHIIAVSYTMLCAAFHFSPITSGNLIFSEMQNFEWRRTGCGSGRGLGSSEMVGAFARLPGLAYRRSTRNMMLRHRNKENFILVLLSIVSSNFMAVHSDVLQRSYVGRWILIRVGIRDALFVHRSTR